MEKYLQIGNNPDNIIVVTDYEIKHDQKNFVKRLFEEEMKSLRESGRDEWWFDEIAWENVRQILKDCEDYFASTQDDEYDEFDFFDAFFNDMYEDKWWSLAPCKSARVEEYSRMLIANRKAGVVKRYRPKVGEDAFLREHFGIKFDSNRWMGESKHCRWSGLKHIDDYGTTLRFATHNRKMLKKQLKSELASMFEDANRKPVVVRKAKRKVDATLREKYIIGDDSKQL